MRKYLLVAIGGMISLCSKAQDDSTNTSTSLGADKKPAVLFNTLKTMNANTTETVGKGKMEFRVGHNFGDIGGGEGGIRSFFGLDGAFDVRIGFEIGLGKRFDLIAARTRGGGSIQQIFELGFKYKIAEQIENDPSHPLAIALFANATVSAMKASPLPNTETSFRGLGDRFNSAIQLIVGRKMGKVTVQLNPTVITRGYSISYDQKNFFALGGAVRLPMTKSVHIILDYFHPFRSQESRDSFRIKHNTRFYDALGVGFEIKVGGHNFNLNFNNATELLENRMIPSTRRTWKNGQFRWGFNLSRTFVLWRQKEKMAEPTL
jgi:hypothetical protein